MHKVLKLTKRRESHSVYIKTKIDLKLQNTPPYMASQKQGHILSGNYTTIQVRESAATEATTGVL